MSMNDIGPILPDDHTEDPAMTEIAENTFLVDAEIAALDPFLFQRIHLLRNERSISAILAAGDDKDFHGRLKETSAAQLEVSPAHFHGNNDKTPGGQKFV